MTAELERLKSEHGWHADSVATFDGSLGIWVAREFQPEDSVYSDSQWTEMDSLIDDSWWYKTRNRIILKVLRRHTLSNFIWDVGCGSGVVGGFLNNQGYSVIGLEPSAAGAVLTAKRGLTSFCGTLGSLALPSESLQNVSMFDVLEHLEDRQAALKECRRVLRPGGLLVLSLPALKLLWSQFDVDGGHFLRYNKRSIRRELSKNGFEVVQSGYFFSLTVLPLFVLRVIPFRLGMRRAVATEATMAADGGLIGRFAAWVELRAATRLPFGSSLLVVARKT